jgi:hypothetical protein
MAPFLDKYYGVRYIILFALIFWSCSHRYYISVRRFQKNVFCMCRCRVPSVMKNLFWPYNIVLALNSFSAAAL